MKISSIDEKLKRIVVLHSNVIINMEDINDETEFIKDLRFNSFKIVEMLAYTELEFGVDTGIENLGMNFVKNYYELRKFILDLQEEK